MVLSSCFRWQDIGPSLAMLEVWRRERRVPMVAVTPDVLPYATTCQLDFSHWRQ
jgi:hypothetical protein